VNNPTLFASCDERLRRADIEGSKSCVAMNAWQPQASYPCGNFSDTSNQDRPPEKGSLSPAFTVHAFIFGVQQQSFYLYILPKVSVLGEPHSGHLRYALTDVPPQPNSPAATVQRWGFRVRRARQVGLRGRAETLPPHTSPAPPYPCFPLTKKKILRPLRTVSRPMTDVVVFQGRIILPPMLHHQHRSAITT